MDTNNKNLLIKICIIVIIIIIIRFLYLKLTNTKTNTKTSTNTQKRQSNIEGFDNNAAIDLLSKIKTHEIIKNNTLANAFTNNSIIKNWSTKLYNMQHNIQSKSISLYQPKLFIKNTQYCKLGDILSQNLNYSPPNSKQVALLIKQNSSDIKPPVSYDLIVNFGPEYVNNKYYEFESYIDDISKINLIKPNLDNTAKTITNLNNLIVANLDILQINLSSKLLLEPTIKMQLLKASNGEVLTNIAMLGLLNKNINSINLTADTSIKLPAGVTGSFTTAYNKAIECVIPSTIDSLQIEDKSIVLSYLPISKFTGLTTNNIDIKTFRYKLFEILPINQIINYLKLLCEDIKIIYDNEMNNITLLKYLNLVDSKDTINNMLQKINDINIFLASYDNINTISINTNPEINEYYTPILNSLSNTNTLLGLILDILKTTNLTYKLTFLTLNIANIIMPPPDSFTDIPKDNTSKDTPIIESFYDWGNFTGFLQGNDNEKARGFFTGSSDVWGGGGSGGGGGGNPKEPDVIKKLTLTSFDNKFLPNIPKNNYNINYNNNYITSGSNIIKNSTQNIITFSKFITDLASNTIENLPLKIYKPNPPPGYITLGHVFCNIQVQLDSISSDALAGKGVCCIPENCIREIRDWNISDKVFEYNKNGLYWAIYYNPFTGTFISTNTNKVLEGKVSKVVACVKKCTAVDELKTADDCARKYYNINKRMNSTVSLAPDLVADQEEVFYLDKLKAQSDSINKLSTRARKMQIDVDKANIINKEMNKNKLQTYVDKQKLNIDLILKRLIEDKNNIETKINIPPNARIELIKTVKLSTDILPEDKKLIINKLINNTEPEINNVCPQYDTTGLVKKSLVSDVCYGCDVVQ